MPDLMQVTDTTNTALRLTARQGAFRDLAEILKDYSNLTQFPQETFTNNLVDGKLYWVSRVCLTEGNAK